MFSVIRGMWLDIMATLTIRIIMKKKLFVFIYFHFNHTVIYGD